MMRAGELNRRITIQHITGTTTNDYGEKISTWGDLATVWASVITTGGREFFAAQRLNEETTAVFRIRYRSDIDPTMRIKYGNRIFEILPPINDVNAKHVELLISAKEVI